MHILEFVLIGVGLLQGLYWLYFLIGFAKIRPVKVEETQEQQGVSVVVAAKNELENLKALLPALQSQDYPNFEIIIVNDRSSDGTLEFLHDFKGIENIKILKVDDLPDHINGKKYALTLGIKAAANETILLTDADCMPFSDQWIASMASKYGPRDQIVLGFSNYRHMPGFLNYFIRFETLLTGIQYLAAASMGAPYMGVGRNLSYTKSLFLSNKGFHGYQDVVGGDDDLFVNKQAKSANTQMAIGSNATTISVPKTTWGSYFNQKVRHMAVGKLYNFAPKFFLSLFALSWILVWVLSIVVLSFRYEPIYVVYLLGGRLLLMLVTFFVAKHKLGIAFNVLGVIFLDVVYAIYYIFAGTRALFAKTIRWR